MTADTTDCIILMTDLVEVRLRLGSYHNYHHKLPNGCEGASTAVGVVISDDRRGWEWHGTMIGMLYSQTSVWWGIT